MTPIFDQYLRRAALPVLELTFDEKGSGVLSMEGRRARVRDADPGGRSREVADHPADGRLEVDAVDAARMRSRWRPISITSMWRSRSGRPAARAVDDIVDPGRAKTHSLDRAAAAQSRRITPCDRALCSRSARAVPLNTTFSSVKSRSRSSHRLHPRFWYRACSTYLRRDLDILSPRRAGMRRKLVAFIFVLAFAAPSCAQTLFQGRIDMTVLDAQGNAVPGALVEIAGPRRRRKPPTPSGKRTSEPVAGRYAVAAALSGFNTYRNDQPRGGRRPQRAAEDHAAGERRRPKRCRSPRNRSSSIRAGRRSPPASPTTSSRSCRRRAIPGSSCRPFPASSSIASTSAARNRVSSRTCSRRAPARPKHLEPRRHPGDRSRLHRIVADLLQLRHVPGDERHDRRSVGDQSDGRRAAQHAVQGRLESRSGRGALLRRGREPAEHEPSR